MPIKKGNLYRFNRTKYLVEVLSTYNHRDIDPECLMSVAIVPMVKYVYISGPDQGRVSRLSFRAFHNSCSSIEPPDQIN